MPGPRAGYAPVIVRVHDDRLGTEVERSAAEVSSPLVHRHCQNGSDCNGSGCRVRTGKTSGEIAAATAFNARMRARHAASRAAARAAIEAIRNAA